MIQQLRIELNETVSGRFDMLNSINTALLKASAKPIVSKPYRISDFIPGTWEGSNDRITPKLHVGLALVDASVVKTKEKCLSALTVPTGSTAARLHLTVQTKKLRSIESSLYQVLHRTTANEPSRRVQQTKGQKGFEAWHAIVRRYDQTNTSDKHSTYAALISYVAE